MSTEAELIGGILPKFLSADLVKKSLPKKTCAVCGQIKSVSLFDKCNQCHRKAEYLIMPQEHKDILLGSVIPPLYSGAELAHLHEKVRKVIADLPEEKGLMLWGAPGVGKTYAMCAIIRNSVESGFTTARTSYEMLCLRIRDTFKQKSIETELSIIRPYLECDRLFIEDIGTTKSEDNIESDFSVRTLLVLLDYRLEQRLPTFFTTNRPVEEIGKTFDARIASRIVQGCEVRQLSGKDRRCQKN